MAEETSETLFIRLYLDEDVFKDIAPALRARGFDAVSVHELGHYGWSDVEHLAYASAERRAIFTFNASDYIALHKKYLAQRETARWHHRLQATPRPRNNSPSAEFAQPRYC